MKLGIIGCGYWGKIIINNLLSLGYEDLVLCDTKEVLDNINIGRKFKRCTNYRRLKCDKVFVLTPSTQHYEICKHFLGKGVDVFCEKVLTTAVETSKDLYRLAAINNAKLFVDWIFTFNQEVNKLKEVYDQGKLGNIKHVTMNRQNFGPERYDVGAKIDLASHDVSVLFYLFDQGLANKDWFCYKRNPASKQNDSTAGLLLFEGYTCLINASWQYTKKDRMCYFDFENGFVTWDDTKKMLKIEYDFDLEAGDKESESKDARYQRFFCIEVEPGSDLEAGDKESESPLHTSLKNFLTNSRFDYKKQETLTLRIIGALE